jgi:hypothetical protein
MIIAAQEKVPSRTADSQHGDGRIARGRVRQCACAFRQRLDDSSLCAISWLFGSNFDFGLTRSRQWSFSNPRRLTQTYPVTRVVRVSMFDFYFACLTFELALRDLRRAPLLTGPVVRGAFGYRLRALACVTRAQSCDDCGFVRWCPYACLMETGNLAGAPRLRGTQSAPHPLVIKNPRAQEGRVQLFMTLVGDALGALPLVVEAVRKMGSGFLVKLPEGGSAEVAFAVERVLVRTASWTDAELSSGRFDGSPVIRLDDLRRLAEGHRLAQASLIFVSPTHLVSNGRPVRQFTFDAFMERLLHRLDVLASCYCGCSMSDEERTRLRELGRQVQVIRDDLSWQNSTRYSTRHRAAVPLDGLIGTCDIAGPLDALLPYLLAGQAVGIGKNTSSGSGDVLVSPKYVPAARTSADVARQGAPSGSR